MIFYAGNYLSEHGFTPTGIEYLTPKLSQRYMILSVSKKQNQIIRLWDMVYSFIKNKKKIKLVLIDSYSMRAFWYTYILSRLSVRYGIPFIPILHGGGYPDRLVKSPDKCNYILRNSLKNISPSLYLKDYFEKAGYEVEYIPNFIPIENYEFKKRSCVRPKLFWVRSFHKIYNPLLALEVLQRLKEKFPSAELCMVGPDKDGTLQSFIDKAKDKGVYDSVRLTGFLSKSEWIELSKEYDIFINTTNFDNQPVSVIEAMALGLPVISTNAGGIPFLIEDNFDGILVPKNDPDKFAEQIERIISDKNLVSKITDNARKKVEGFDWEEVKHKWFGIIDTVIKE
jgi:L-malate glycosyltransferase